VRIRRLLERPFGSTEIRDAGESDHGPIGAVGGGPGSP
jgi:hypothetical protein